MDWGLRLGEQREKGVSKRTRDFTSQWQLWFVPMPTEKSTDRGLGKNCFDFANYHNCNINQLEMQLFPFLCSRLILFNLAIYLGWGESVQAGMHVLEQSDGEAGKQPWYTQNCFHEKGWEHQDQALLHSQLRALGIQTYPVTQLGCQSADEYCGSRLCFLCIPWLSFFNIHKKCTDKTKDLRKVPDNTSSHAGLQFHGQIFNNGY